MMWSITEESMIYFEEKETKHVVELVESARAVIGVDEDFKDP